MLKALLLASVLAWPFTAIAQDAPAAPKDDAPVMPIEQVMGRLCLRPLTAEVSNALAKQYSVAMVYDSPITKGFIRNMVFKLKKDVDNKNSVLVVSTFIREDNVVGQCITGFGGYDNASVELMKKKWETDPPVAPEGGDKSAADPLTNPPADGTKAAPSFQNNPDE
jgi:hypothetical protein